MTELKTEPQKFTIEEIVEKFNAQLLAYGYREIKTITIETKHFGLITYDRNGS